MMFWAPGGRSVECLSEVGEGGGESFGPGPGVVEAEIGLSGGSGESAGDVKDSVSEGVDLAAGDVLVFFEADEFGPADQVGGGEDYFEPGMIFWCGPAGKVVESGGFGLTDPVLDTGVESVA